MKTKIINVYEFNELSQEAQEKVLNGFRDRNDFSFLSDYLEDELKQELEIKGIKPLNKTELFYSLSNCQGDGVSFVGDFMYKGITIYVRRGTNFNHYVHKNSVSIEYDEEEKEILEADFKEHFFNEFKVLYSDICDTIEKYGYEQIEHENSEEAIKENIEVNEYMFLENGELE